MKDFFVRASVAFLFFLTSCATHKAPQPAVESPTPQKVTIAPSAEPSSGEVKPFFESTHTPAPGEKSENNDVVEEVIGEEVEEEIAKSVPPQFDIPIVMNAMVSKWIDYFQHGGRKIFANWMARSGRYIPMMKRILRENGLPEDLVYLSMIESGFKPYAYSRAKASGPWQFMKGTGARYGLNVTWWIDERRDPEKSSIAAAQHLKDLYDQFNSWYLAAAGYNAGAGKISRAMAKYSTEDFWEMSRFRYLKPETKNYVPKMIAAALIAKEPEKYGFIGIEYESPEEYEKVIVKEPVLLDAVAQSLGIGREALVEFNPELRRAMTPPDTENYELKIPKGYKSKFEANFSTIREKSTATIVRHVAKRGESLSQISRRYGMPQQVLLSFNQLKSSRLKPGMQIAIPVKSGEILRSDRMDPEDTVVRRSERPRGGQKYMYQVRAKDTLWSISRQFRVSVTDIRAWNKLSNREGIQVGQRLTIYSRSAPPTLGPSKDQERASRESWKFHRVRRGETLWEIARSYGVSVSQLSGWNDLDSHDVRAGKRLKVRVVKL